MKRFVVVVAMFLVFFQLCGEVSARLAQNARGAVVLEAYYALTQSVGTSCLYRFEKSDNCASGWNYLASNSNVHLQLMRHYGCDNSTVWKKSGDSYMDGTKQKFCFGSAVYSFVTDIPAYGFNRHNTIGKNWYDPSYGRGGQCKYFANLILYRSGTHSAMFPSYSSMEGNSFKLDSDSNLEKVKEGDVIFQTNVHTAIVVGIVRSNGKVTSIDVIDSNFVGGNGNEIIGKHRYSKDQLRSYRVWKGTSYYTTNYDPNSR